MHSGFLAMNCTDGGVKRRHFPLLETSDVSLVGVCDDIKILTNVLLACVRRTFMGELHGVDSCRYH